MRSVQTPAVKAKTVAWQKMAYFAACACGGNVGSARLKSGTVGSYLGKPTHLALEAFTAGFGRI
jgi:hypothetical protein